MTVETIARVANVSHRYEATVALDDVTKSYGKVRALRGLALAGHAPNSWNLARSAP